ncbi:molybdopterin synthase catalytic subunit [Galendromus occidentalis]|uniref:Molybdopterin synthase catalytic subunit n=1 Tax=Galendromus occidentalis TaxID=34638 RepID=A0AAJ7L7V7_9ACAR|nr:molybdopterin synthase catalytic subunit [Galendromus occidentalis]
MSTEGWTKISLTSDPLDVGAALSSARSSDCGAISIFLGTTRADIVDGKKVEALRYEAYEAMALKIMQALCDQVRKIYPVKNLIVSHRTGVVKVKEDSIMIICVGGHRSESIKATEWLINEIKAKLPVWKKEIFVNGLEEWIENKETFWRE